VSEDRKRRNRAAAQQGGKVQEGLGLNINTVWQIKVFPDNTDAGNDEPVHIAYLYDQTPAMVRGISKAQ